MRKEIGLIKILDFAGKLLFPPRCPVCDEPRPLGQGGICINCLPKLKYAENPRCFKCGKHLEDGEEEYCTDCSSRSHYYLAGRALYDYQMIAPSIYRFKYNGRQEYAEVFGEEMAYYLGDFLRKINPDALIPVPMYRSKERRRGYNQAALLAHALGRNMGIPVYDHLVERVRNTKPLKLLNPEERLNNLKKAFILAENGVKLNTIVIVDDVYTTGSTIDEITKVLLEDGDRKIYFVTLAIGETV